MGENSQQEEMRVFTGRMLTAILVLLCAGLAVMFVFRIPQKTDVVVMIVIAAFVKLQTLWRPRP